MAFLFPPLPADSILRSAELSAPGSAPAGNRPAFHSFGSAAGKGGHHPFHFRIPALGTINL